MYEHYHLHPDHVIHEMFKRTKTSFCALPTELIQRIYEYLFDVDFCSVDKAITLHYDIIHDSNIPKTEISCIDKLQHNLFVINLTNYVLLKRFYFRDDVLLPLYTKDVKYFTDGIHTSLIDYLIEHNLLLYLCILMKIHDFIPRNHFVINWCNKTNELNYELNWLFNNFII